MNWNDIVKKYLMETLEFVKNSTASAASEGQKYVKELLKWEGVKHLLSFLGFFSVAIITALIANHFYNKIGLPMKCVAVSGNENEFRCIGDNPEWLFWLLTGLLATGAIAALVKSAIDFKLGLKVCVAPRVVIIEKLSGMMNEFNIKESLK